MEFPSFDLPLADGGRMGRDDLLGRPWHVYMARHPGCFVCQAKLADALAVRDELRAAGGELLLTFQASEEYATMWTRRSKENGDIPADLPVLIDPDAALYDAVGTTRGFHKDVGRTLGSLWRSRGHIAKWRLTPNDMTRMGADVGLDLDGSIAFRHICRDPEDRADPRDVIAAVTA